jgi:hypothetical protein
MVSLVTTQHYYSKITFFQSGTPKIHVKNDFLVCYLYLPLIWKFPFHERVCNKVIIDSTYRKGTIKFIVKSHKCQTYITVGQKSLQLMR